MKLRPAKYGKQNSYTIAVARYDKPNKKLTVTGNSASNAEADWLHNLPPAEANEIIGVLYNGRWID